VSRSNGPACRPCGAACARTEVICRRVTPACSLVWAHQRSSTRSSCNGRTARRSDGPISRPTADSHCGAEQDSPRNSNDWRSVRIDCRGRDGVVLNRSGSQHRRPDHPDPDCIPRGRRQSRYHAAGPAVASGLPGAAVRRRSRPHLSPRRRARGGCHAVLFDLERSLPLLADVVRQRHEGSSERDRHRPGTRLVERHPYTCGTRSRPSRYVQGAARPVRSRVGPRIHGHGDARAD
jgi:hypothetical protein